MNKVVKLIIFETVVLVALLLIFLFLPVRTATQKPNSKDVTEVCFEENCFLVEVADDPFEQAQGLMFRENLEKNRGMLFVMEEERVYPFWMKNTLIPLGMIWINKNLEVVAIAENTQPCPLDEEDCPKINPNANASHVLEVNGGLAREINIQLGDKMSLK